MLTHVRPERAGAAAGILTTTQQFGAASGIAVIGAVFYAALGAAPDRGTFVSAMVVAMSVNAALVAIAAWLMNRGSHAELPATAAPLVSVGVRSGNAAGST